VRIGECFKGFAVGSFIVYPFGGWSYKSASISDEFLHPSIHFGR